MYVYIHIFTAYRLSTHTDDWTEHHSRWLRTPAQLFDFPCQCRRCSPQGVWINGKISTWCNPMVDHHFSHLNGHEVRYIAFSTNHVYILHMLSIWQCQYIYIYIYTYTYIYICIFWLRVCIYSNYRYIINCRQLSFNSCRLATIDYVVHRLENYNYHWLYRS